MDTTKKIINQLTKFELTLKEKQLILFAISKIKPTDTKYQEYIFHLKDFYDICGIKENDSYAAIKNVLTDIRKKNWMITIDDPHNPGKTCESSISWFEVIRLNQHTKNVTIGFHPYLMPYLSELSRQRYEDGVFEPNDDLHYIELAEQEYDRGETISHNDRNWK